MLHKHSMAGAVNSTVNTPQKWDSEVQLSCKPCSRHLVTSDLQVLVSPVPEDLGLSPTRT